MSDSPAATGGDKLFAALQFMLPTHLLSRGMHRLARCRVPWFKRLVITRFCRLYAIDLDEVEQPDLSRYPSFNAFFTRALRPGARPLPADPGAVACPVDGVLGQFGALDGNELLQAKGQRYSLQGLLQADPDLTAEFTGGDYATLYLAPSNYHRIHMPAAARLRETHYLPGRLFGVNPRSVRGIARLFTRNERVTAIFDTPAGPLAMVLVGAFFVGSIETVWAGEITPPHRRPPRRWPATPQDFARGEEMGRFNLGSTVILLAGPGVLEWASELTPGQPLRLGQTLGQALGQLTSSD